MFHILYVLFDTSNIFCLRDNSNFFAHKDASNIFLSPKHQGLWLQNISASLFRILSPTRPCCTFSLRFAFLEDQDYNTCTICPQDKRGLNVPNRSQTERGGGCKRDLNISFTNKSCTRSSPGTMTRYFSTAVHI